MGTGLKNRQNLATYAAFFAISVAGLFYGKHLLDSLHPVRVWDIGNLAFLTLGVPFLFFQSKAGLPDFWESSVGNRNRLLLPFLVGAFFGLLDILVVKVMLHPDPYVELPPFLQPFPYSVFLYTSGAFEVEVFYRLIPLTILLSIGRELKKGAYHTQFLWAALLLTSLREPIEQFPEGSLWFVCYSLLAGFLMNFVQARLFTLYGFVASLTVRLGHYLFWHILLGVYVQFYELW